MWMSLPLFGHGLAWPRLVLKCVLGWSHPLAAPLQTVVGLLQVLHTCGVILPCPKQATLSSIQNTLLQLLGLKLGRPGLDEGCCLVCLLSCQCAAIAPQLTGLLYLTGWTIASHVNHAGAVGDSLPGSSICMSSGQACPTAVTESLLFLRNLVCKGSSSQHSDSAS